MAVHALEGRLDDTRPEDEQLLQLHYRVIGIFQAACEASLGLCLSVCVVVLDLSGYTGEPSPTESPNHLVVSPWHEHWPPPPSAPPPMPPPPLPPATMEHIIYGLSYPVVITSLALSFLSITCALWGLAVDWNLYRQALSPSVQKLKARVRTACARSGGSRAYQELY